MAREKFNNAAAFGVAFKQYMAKSQPIPYFIVTMKGGRTVTKFQTASSSSEQPKNTNEIRIKVTPSKVIVYDVIDGRRLLKQTILKGTKVTKTPTVEEKLGNLKFVQQREQAWSGVPSAPTATRQDVEVLVRDYLRQQLGRDRTAITQITHLTLKQLRKSFGTDYAAMLDHGIEVMNGFLPSAPPMEEVIETMPEPSAPPIEEMTQETDTTALEGQLVTYLKGQLKQRLPNGTPQLRQQYGRQIMRESRKRWKKLTPTYKVWSREMESVIDRVL